MPSKLRSLIKPVQEMFKKIVDVPFCSGTVPLNATQSLLFYRYKGKPKMIDFANPSQTQLKALADACHPASFGRNREDLIDENYRKAGKMDPVDFAAQFSPWDSGILRTAVETLCKTNNSTTNLAVELYKLNVYGPGSFFKAHVDTPRSDTMFGSLVVVLPTHHIGGSLLFRHHDNEYTFDSSRTVSTSPPDSPCAAFTAFFSDVKHEIAEVTSGYRVTLTYNLYHASPSPLQEPLRVTTIDGETQNLSTIKTTLASLLSNPNFFPDGGLLAFGLAYEYPFEYESAQLSDMAKHLKGTDVLLQRACEELDLHASLKAVYHEIDSFYNKREGKYAFADNFVRLPEDDFEEKSLLEHIRERGRRVVIAYDALSGRPTKDDAEDDEEYGPETILAKVVWAKPLNDKNTFKEKYIAYGNEASLMCAYGVVCLVARVQPANERN